MRINQNIGNLNKIGFYHLIPLSLILTSCLKKANQTNEKPNILWITHEDFSPDYGCYGDSLAQTPNIDSFSKTAIRFNNAFSNAPICAPARSTLITGIYATSLGTQHLRSDIQIPDSILILPQLLSKAGYYTTNNLKTDYNFDPTNRWDDCSKTAHWRNRPKNKPFFSVFNCMITHEGPINELNLNDTKSIVKKVDPEQVVMPPYLPESPQMRKIWAHKYDLLSVFDQNVGELLSQLHEDGLNENTIVFIFSDHGTGLPGHKRWLNNAGLRVPFLLHLPSKYENWYQNYIGDTTNRLVAFVDFAPTVLEMAGVEIPNYIEGHSFARVDQNIQKYIYGYRDRADDCYDMARAISDGQYIYIHHFMPHLPYYQNAIVFHKQGSYTEIDKLKSINALPEPSLRMFQPRPVEVLYDLKNDRYEQTNLINQVQYQDLIETFRMKLEQWMLDYYDTGLFNEGHYMEMAKEANKTVYETVRGLEPMTMKRLLIAAKIVGNTKNANELIPLLQSDDDQVRYWGLVAADAFRGDIAIVKPELKKLLHSGSKVVSSLAAKVLIKNFEDKEAYDQMKVLLLYDYEPVVLQTAIYTRELESLALPLAQHISDNVCPKYTGPIWGRYKSWSYPMFIGMALDQSLINCKILSSELIQKQIMEN